MQVEGLHKASGLILNQHHDAQAEGLSSAVTERPKERAS